MASPASFRKLKPGAGLTADAVAAAAQRRRIHEAMISLIVERGYERITVQGLAEFAGASTHSFYEHYANLEECFAYVCDATLLGALHRAESRSTSSCSWEEGVHAGMRSLMEDAAKQPAATRVALVDAFSAGPWIETRVTVAIQAFEQMLVEQMLAFGLRPAAPPLLITGFVAGTMTVVRRRVLTDEAYELPGLATELSRWILSIPHEQADPDRADKIP